MAETTRQKLEFTARDVADIVTVVLAEPGPDVAPLSAASGNAKVQITKIVAGAKMPGGRFDASFGTVAQEGMHKSLQDMLADTGGGNAESTADTLGKMLTTLKGFSLGGLQMRRHRTWWERLTGAAAPQIKIMARQKSVLTRIDRNTGDLLDHQNQLVQELATQHDLYDKTLQAYDQIGTYIAAGDAVLSDLDANTATLQDSTIATTNKSGAPNAGPAPRSQRPARDDLERRVHDLHLTRQATLQSLPSVRVARENDAALVKGVNAALVNLIPQWQAQLSRAVTDERTSYDTVLINSANDELIGSICGILETAGENKVIRTAAEVILRKVENELHTTLMTNNVTRTGTGEAQLESVSPE